MLNFIKGLFQKKESPKKKVYTEREVDDSMNEFYTSLSEKDIGRKYIVVTECTCAESLHEMNKYPRPGIKVEILNPGDILRYEGPYTNCYGDYDRFEKIDEDRRYTYNIEFSKSARRIKRLEE